MQVRFCKDDVELDSPALHRLRASEASIADDRDAMQTRLAEDGYLFIKGLLDRDQVLEARRTILAYMEAREGLEPGARPLDGVMGQYGKTVPMMGRRTITHHPAVTAVLESPRLFQLYETLFAEPARTLDFKWLRAVGNEESTGCHMDHVYMGRGSPRIMTCWVPLADIPITQGTLAVCRGSHGDVSFQKLRDTYGRMDVDRDQVEGWFTRHPREITDTFGGQWLTDDVHAGDVITFGMHLMHASTTNVTQLWRLSCDVRFQPASEPADPRWIGENPTSHDPAGQLTTITDARKAWGV